MEVVNAAYFQWTAERYMRFAENDIFVAEDRVELLIRIIVQAPQANYRHANASAKLNKFFVLGSADRYAVHIRAPLLLDDWSVPEPDLCLIDCNTYKLMRHPGPEHVYLLVEIAESSLTYDRNEKLQAYARQQVRDYWIVNLQDNIFEVYREPEGGQFESVRKYGLDETVSPLAFPDLKLRGKEICF